MLNKILLSVFVFCALKSQAQEPSASIRGAIMDQTNIAIPFVNVLLLKESDSTLVKAQISDTLGVYRFDKVSEGKYFITAGMIGKEKYFSGSFSLAGDSNLNLPAIILKDNATQLNAVEIVSEKPFVEQQLDRLVLNVENSSIHAGSSVFEILQKSPGISIDDEHNLSINGKKGVSIEINGRRTYLTGAELAARLRSMQSSLISKVEIISNPSAKYEAAGSSGIINIVLKKNENEGWNSNSSIGFGYGRYPKFYGDVSLNYRKGKINIYGDYGIRLNKTFSSRDIDRTIHTEEKDILFLQETFRTSKSTNQSYRFGIDYYLNEKEVIGFLSSGFINDAKNILNNETSINSQNQVDSYFTLANKNPAKLDNVEFDLNYKKSFDTPGKELTADVDYARFNNTSKDNINTLNYGTGSSILNETSIRSNTASEINIKALKVDYIQPLKAHDKLEIGAKSSWVDIDNRINFEIYDTDSWRIDDSLSNTFNYEEQINSLYFNYKKEISKIDFQLGLRTEHTRSSANSPSLEKVVDKDYVKLFPSLFINYRINNQTSVNASYSRRIDRPSYQNLNPSIYYIDPYTYYQGNPFLLPQYTNSMQVAWRYKDLSTSIYYSVTKDVATTVMEQNDSTKVSKSITVNLNSLTNFGGNIYLPITIAKWWSVYNSLNLVYSKYESPYLGGTVSNGQFTASISHSHSVTLPKEVRMEVSLYYQAPKAYGIEKVKSSYSLSLGLQKTFFKKLSVKLNFSDLFYNSRYFTTLVYQNMNIATRSKWESREFRINLNYIIGKTTIKSSRQRNSVIEGEKGRAMY